MIMEKLLILATIILLIFVKSTRVHIWLILILFCAIIHSGKTTAMVGLPKLSDNYPADTEILIRYKVGASLDRRRALSTTHGFKPIRHFERFGIHRWQLKKSDGKVLMEQVLTRLREEPEVEWAEPNYRRYPMKLPNDQMFGSQWHLDNRGQSGGTPGADIQAVDAWDMTTGNSDVVVAILDSGIDYTHPDLRKNMWHNPGEDWTAEDTPGNNGIDDDHNGYIDDYFGIDAVNESGNPIDTLGHGTHVAGIVGAVGNNGVGITGVTWHVQLMALKFLDPYGSVADEIECISYILDQKEKGIPVRVVNASFGDSSSSLFEKEAIESLMSAGIMMPASAGNVASDLDGLKNNYPASYALQNIISVAASDNNDRLAFFSNYGFHSVDIAAPGVEILSTYLNGSYDTLSGTSMVAPQVSGALALLYAQKPRSVEEARERILRGVDQNDYLSGRLFSNGRLNVFNALRVDLRGPFIFSVFPISGSPGSEVTITGVRFRDGNTPESRVTFGDMEATITNWGDTQIVCLIPHGTNVSADGNAIKVHNASGVSNEVLFGTTSYRYHLPFAPAKSPWDSYLILCNYGLETVNARVFAGPSGSYVIEPQTEVLYPWEVIYVNLKDYGLTGNENLLWVESEKDIGVDIIVFNAQPGGFTMIPAQRR